MDLPNFDNLMKYANWFKEKSWRKVILTIWFILPIPLFAALYFLADYTSDLRTKVENIKDEIAPIKLLYPKLELSGAVSKLIDDYKKINSEHEKLKERTIELENKLKPRGISRKQFSELISILKAGSGKEVRVCSAQNDKEAYKLARIIFAAFKTAQWKTDAFGMTNCPGVSGILITSKNTKTEEAKLIEKAFSKIGLQSKWMRGSDNFVMVSVCQKP